MKTPKRLSAEGTLLCAAVGLLCGSVTATCQTFTILKSFGDSTVTGFQPHSQLVQGPDGTLYGTTYEGEGSVRGTVFKMRPDGSGFTVQAGLTLSGGVLYGTTVQGGALGEGTVFKLELADGGELRITSIVPSTNGVKVAWTNSLPGHAYTLQVRDSLSFGNWSNAPTRYRWPGLMGHWVEPAVPQGRTRFYRVMAEPAPVPQRGKVLGVTLLQTLSTATIQATLQTYGLPTAQTRWPVRFYKVLYETVDPFGLAITASGALYIPQGPTNSLPLVSLQHGTTALKSFVPSRGNSYGDNAFGLLLATAGYVSQLPDYLGMGDPPGFEAYLHAKTEATTVVDMFRAVRQFGASNSVNLNSQLFLAGYSQGGHVTMAAHREIETYHSDEFTITASAPISGPYDLSGVTWNYALTNLSLRGYYPLLIAAWLPIYNLGDTFEGILRAPYDRTLAPLYDGLHTDDQIGLALPSDGWTVLRPDYLESLLSDPKHPLRQAGRDNDVYQWTPVAPMHLYHCSGDTLVPQANSIVAYQTFTNNGARCVSLIDPGSPQRYDHRPGWFSAQEWDRWPAGPYLIVSRADGQLLGSTGFAFQTPQEAMVGYVLAGDAWGKGFATEALTAIVDVAARIGVNRLFAPCHPEHRPSQRVLEKCGFVRDHLSKPMVEFPNLSPGVRREALYYAVTVSARTNHAS